MSNGDIYWLNFKEKMPSKERLLERVEGEPVEM